MALESKGIPSPDVVTAEGGHKGGQCPSIEVLGDHGWIASSTAGGSEGRATAVGGGTVCPLTIIPSLVGVRVGGGQDGGQESLPDMLGACVDCASSTAGGSTGLTTIVGGRVWTSTSIPSFAIIAGGGRMEGCNCLQEHWWTMGDECCLPQVDTTKSPRHQRG